MRPRDWGDGIGWPEWLIGCGRGEEVKEDAELSDVDNCEWMISGAIYWDRKDKKRNELREEIIPYSIYYMYEFGIHTFIHNK